MALSTPPIRSETVHTDIWEGAVPDVHYGYRTGTVVRRPSDDPGEATETGRALQVEGITDGSQILFNLVPFTPGGAVFKVLTKTLAGRRIDVYAN